VVNDQLSHWQGEDGAPLRAGVSSFGVGGTNAHVVVEQAPERPASDPAVGPQLLVLSARTPAALATAAANLADFLELGLKAPPAGERPAPALNLADVAWTLAAGRKAFPHRIALSVIDAADAVEPLRSPLLAAGIRRGTPARACDPVFAFPGQGSQYPRMGRALYETEPAFAAAFDECVAAMPNGLGLDQRRRMLSEDPAELLPTSVMQPAIFIVEYALAMLWMDWGLVPSAMIGHSVGEFVAATLAGVFTLPDAMRLVCARGALMQAQPAGAMLSVKLPLAELQECLPEDVSVAAENAPGSCVASGPQDAIERLRDQLHALGVSCRELQTSHAFHSAMMEPVVAPFRDLVASVPRSAPTIPIMSTARAEWLDEQAACSPEYWSEHLRKPVRFASALARLLASPNPLVLLEVGPRTTLGTLARQQPELGNAGGVAISSLGDAEDNEAANLRLAAGQLWSRGVALELAKLDRRSNRRRVLLPTYPFERQRHWVDASPAVAPAAMPATVFDHEVGVGNPPVAEGTLSGKLAGILSHIGGLWSGKSVDAVPALRATAEPGLLAATASASASPGDAGEIGGLEDARERLLANLFREQLDCPDIGRDDNFFQLGGDSLSAVQLMKRLEQATGVRLNLLNLAKGTVGSLARELPGTAGAGTGAAARLPSMASVRLEGGEAGA
jgi:acyl transferase domain-containing protein